MCFDVGMLTEELFQALEDADYGVWSASAITGVVTSLGGTGLGWTGDPETDEYELLWTRADGAEARAPRTADDDRAFEFGDIRLLSVSIEADDLATAYPAAVEAAVRVFGPPPYVGGPDAYLRWRSPTISVELSRQIRASTITVTVEPTAPAEWYAHSLARGGAAQEYAWRAYPPLPQPYAARLDGAMFYAPQLAESMEDFGDHLDDVFRSLAVDVPTLYAYTGDVVWTIGAPDGRFVQGWFGAGGSQFEIGGADALETADYPVTREAGREIARRVMDTLTAYGVTSPEDLSTSAWASADGTGLERLFRAPVGD